MVVMPSRTSPMINLVRFEQPWVQLVEGWPRTGQRCLLWWLSRITEPTHRRPTLGMSTRSREVAGAGCGARSGTRNGACASVVGLAPLSPGWRGPGGPIPRRRPSPTHAFGAGLAVTDLPGGGLGSRRARSAATSPIACRSVASVTDNPRVRVVLADDDVLLREGLASLLERSGFEVVGQARDP